MPINKNKIFKFQLVDITQDKFSFNSLNLPTNKKFSFEFGFSFGINPEKKAILCKVLFNFLNENSVSFFVLELGYHFVIHPDDWSKIQISKSVNSVISLSSSSNSFIIPKSLATHLLMISVSTSRGLIFSKSEFVNNKFKVIIPLINVEKNIKNDIEIILPKN